MQRKFCSETVPLTDVKASKYQSDDDDDTSSSTISSDEAEEIFKDCESGTSSGRLVELEESEGQFADGQRPGTSSGSQNSADGICNRSTNSTGEKVKKAYDALLYHAADIHSSSEESKKTLSNQSSVDLGCIMEYRVDESGNLDYIQIDFNTMIEEKDITKLMKKLRLNHYTAVSYEGDFVLSKCKALFERDYQCEVIDNSGGSLSRHYPARMIVPVAKKAVLENEGSSRVMEFDKQLYLDAVKRSVSSRLRTRFVVPAIMFDNKFICRSGTLSVRKTAVYETARQNEPPKSIFIAAWAIQRAARFLANSIREASNRGYKATSQLLVPSSMDKLKDVDAQIIRYLKIHYICDLMIEDRKKFKQAIRLSSSEKINTDIYNDISIEQMPYPGCKLFKQYHNANYVPEGLVFDWNRSDVNTELMFSEDPHDVFPEINWDVYKMWDIVDLTKNYLKVLLSYLAKGQGGLLVHCISGWDRTPLFISILRASLWADGVIHESLNYRDLAYLTLAYDWYLFGHDLPARLRKKQEIMHFCFKFMSYITEDEFSITRIFHEFPYEQKSGRTFPEFVPGKRDMIRILSHYLQSTYQELITNNPE